MGDLPDTQPTPYFRSNDLNHNFAKGKGRFLILLRRLLMRAGLIKILVTISPIIRIATIALITVTLAFILGKHL
ncbi:hypothetical protein NIES4074_38990 [Cylindrospermum sp. NIES-4074]|nr:hypothetical protein NIES4074_38990 [Cylindrospermum sp. NIES-4074]